MQINLCVVLELLKHRLVPLSYSPNLALFESLFLEYLQYFVRLTVSLVPHLAPLIQKFFCIPDGPQLAVSVLIDPVHCSFLSTFRSVSPIACLWFCERFDCGPQTRLEEESVVLFLSPHLPYLFLRGLTSCNVHTDGLSSSFLILSYPGCHIGLAIGGQSVLLIFGSSNCGSVCTVC